MSQRHLVHRPLFDRLLVGERRNAFAASPCDDLRLPATRRQCFDGEEPKLFVARSPEIVRIKAQRMRDEQRRLGGQRDTSAAGLDETVGQGTNFSFARTYGNGSI